LKYFKQRAAVWVRAKSNNFLFFHFIPATFTSPLLIRHDGKDGILILRLNFVGGFPYFEETDRRVKPIKDGQRHRDVSDDGPGPLAEEEQMGGSKLGSVLLQGVDCPHCHVGDDEERDQFLPGFVLDLFEVATAAPPPVQDEHRLERRLDEGEDLGDESRRGAVGHGEVTPDHREHAVDEHAGLGDDEQRVVQTYARLTFGWKQCN
jgi:hypothetical protein